VGAQELYCRFRKRIEDLANCTQPRDQCLAELRDVLQRFDAEIADLDMRARNGCAESFASNSNWKFCARRGGNDVMFSPRRSSTWSSA
jgi:hypothetical protein